MIDSSTLAVLLAQIMGIALSMLFCLDFWWTKVTREISSQITIQKRLKFIAVASLAAIVATFTTSLITGFNGRVDSYILILITWVVLGFFALAKFVFMVIFIHDK